MTTTPPPAGLMGFLFQSDPESIPAPGCKSICEMAEEIRHRIMHAFNEMLVCPDKPIMIDGEQWAPDRMYSALRNLYDWTYRACRQEEPQAAAFISSNFRCS